MHMNSKLCLVMDNNGLVEGAHQNWV